MGERLATRCASGLWGFSFGAEVPVAQSGEFGQAFTERKPVPLTTTTLTSVSALDLYGSESRAQAPAEGTKEKELQPIGGSEFGGRPEGNVDVASARSFALIGLSFITTNCLGSINALVEERCAEVERWMKSHQRQRCLAAALLDIEPRLRKLRAIGICQSYERPYNETSTNHLCRRSLIEPGAMENFN